MKFRNPNGVSLKLSNFLALDPNYSGKGMESYSKLDQEVFEEFLIDKKDLILADTIKRTTKNSDLSAKLYKIEDDPDDDSFSVKEGKVIYRLHKHIENLHRLIRRRKSPF